MYKTIFNKRNSLKFNRFSNKNYSLFAVLGREVLVGALSVATLSHAIYGKRCSTDLLWRGTWQDKCRYRKCNMCCL